MRLFKPGDIIDIIDDIDYDIIHTCTVRLVEKDEEIDGLYYYYVRSNDESENINYDARIGTFWRLIESNSEKII